MEEPRRFPEPPRQTLALRPSSLKTTSLATSEYEYKPLAPDEIRMLILLPGYLDDPLQGYITHEHFDPSDRTFTYEALSYVWGAQTDPKTFHVLEWISETCSTEVATLQIGQNLDAALRSIRSPSIARTIWCDAICINQKDVDERGVQVRRMGKLFHHAARVVVWLGPETDSLYRAMQIMKFLGSIFYYDFDESKVKQYPGLGVMLAHHLFHTPFHLADWHSIYDFFDLPWFKRLWVKQEIILAGDAIIMIGKHELDWSGFCGASHCLYDLRVPLSGPFNERERQEMFDFLRNILSTFLFSERGLLRTLEMSNHCECLDPRDKIYGILGLHEFLHVEPNYRKDYRDVYTEFFRELAGFGGRMITFPICNTADDAGWMHPSWVPDLTKRIPTFSYVAVGDAGGHAPGRHQILPNDSCKVLAVHCGTISRCSTAMPPKIMPDACRTVINSWILDVSSNSDQALSQARIEELVNTILFGHTQENVTGGHWNLRKAADGLLCGAKWYSPQEPWHELDEKRLIDDILYWGICETLLAENTAGKYALAVGTARVGDEIYVIPGCRLPVILRTAGDGRYKVVGPCFMQSLARSEALLGQLPEGWKMKFHIHNPEEACFIDPDGLTQNQDPRLGELPPGWETSEPTRKGQILYRHEPEIPWSQRDPRLLPKRLAARGVKLEELVII